MKKVFATISFLFFLFQADAQTLQRFEGYCGYYSKSMADFYKQKEKELAMYDLKPGQTVASIGAQCGQWEAGLAASSDSVHFYLEDIDTTYFNERQVGFAWHYYDSLRGKPMTSDYKLVLGTEKSTLLPENTFDKVIIINSFHEFTKQEEMLADIKTKLKSGGILYIDEAVAKKTGELHAICKKRKFTPDELITMLEKNGYSYINRVDMMFRKERPLRIIFAFKKR
jgi:predicted methyltransferase